jgi:peroxiredoxin
MKISVLLLVLSVTLTAQAQKSFTINGNLKGLPENTVLELRNDDLSSTPLATGTSKAGNFELKGVVDDPNIYLLTYAGNQQRLAIFMDNSAITVKGSIDSLSKAKVTGSPSHDHFTKFNDEFNPLFAKLSKIVKHINEGKPDPGGSMKRDYDKTILTLQQKTDEFVKQYPASPVTPFVILVMTQLNTEVGVTERRYNALVPEIRQAYYGKMLEKSIAEGKIGSIGSDAIDFVQNDTTGKPVALSSLRGKYVLIDFWASWCRPCRMENPNVVDAYNKYKDKNFTVLGVSLDRAKEPWVKAINDDGLSWTQVSDLKFWNNEAAIKYKIESIPRNFLLDPNGKIIAKDLRGDELHKTLKSLLN